VGGGRVWRRACAMAGGMVGRRRPPWTAGHGWIKAVCRVALDVSRALLASPRPRDTPTPCPGRSLPCSVGSARAPPCVTPGPPLRHAVVPRPRAAEIVAAAHPDAATRSRARWHPGGCRWSGSWWAGGRVARGQDDSNEAALALAGLLGRAGRRGDLSTFVRSGARCRLGGGVRSARPAGRARLPRRSRTRTGWRSSTRRLMWWWGRAGAATVAELAARRRSRRARAPARAPGDHQTANAGGWRPPAGRSSFPTPSAAGSGWPTSSGPFAPPRASGQRDGVGRPGRSDGRRPWPPSWPLVETHARAGPRPRRRTTGAATGARHGGRR